MIWSYEAAAGTPTSLAETLNIFGAAYFSRGNVSRALPIFSIEMGLVLKEIGQSGLENFD
ncbi:MAG: hypothetical protein AAF468_18905 [Pseudomonadota bacterium]